jgi:hypothetical protein
MTKFVRLAVIAVAAATITSQAHALGPGPENPGRAAIQEPGATAFYQSLGSERSGYRAPAEAYGAIGAFSASASQPARRSDHRGKPISGPR